MMITFPPVEHIVSSFAHAAPGLSVSQFPSPVKLVVDSDGVDEVESIEPEEETGDPAGQLMDMVVIMMILLMNMLTCNSSREVAV